MGYVVVRKLESATSFNRCLIYLDQDGRDLPDLTKPYTDFAPGSVAEAPLCGKRWVLGSHKQWIPVHHEDVFKFEKRVEALEFQMRFVANDVHVFASYEAFPQPVGPDWMKVLQHGHLYIAEDTRTIYELEIITDENGNAITAQYKRLVQELQAVDNYAAWKANPKKPEAASFISSIDSEMTITK